MYENTRKHKFNVSINTNELSHQIKLKLYGNITAFPTFTNDLQFISMRSQHEEKYVQKLVLFDA